MYFLPIPTLSSPKLLDHGFNFMTQPRREFETTHNICWNSICLIHIIHTLVMAKGRCTHLGIKTDPKEQNIYRET